MALGNIAISITIDQKFKDELDKAEKEVKKFADKVNDELGKAGKSGLQAFGDSLDRAGKKISDVGASITKLTAPISIGLGLATKAAIDFEEGMADIAKTTGATGAQLDEISDGLKNIAINTRTSIEDLQNIATIGGQLGVPTNDILEFTDAVDKLNVALGDEFSGGAEEISNAIGVLRNNFRDIKSDKIDQDLLRIGNAVNELGAAGLATGPVVVDFAQRISGLTSTLGQSSGDILGLSATLQELGVTAERGGSAVGRIFQKMAQDTEKFAKISGKSLSEFENLVNTDINEAFITVLEGVNNSADAATEFADVLDELGLKGVGNAEVFQKLGANVDLLREKQDLANKSLQGTSSILDEFNKKNSTTQANINKLKNNFQVLGIEIGSAFLPVINDLVSKLLPQIQKMTKAFSDLPDPVKKGIVIIAGLVAALGPLLIIVGQLISAVGTILPVLGSLGTALGALASPVGVVVGALALLGAAFVVLAAKFGLLEDIRKKLEEFLSGVQKTVENVRKAFDDPKVQAALQRLQDAFNKLAEATKPIFDALQRLIDTIFKPLQDQMAENEGAFISLEGAVNLLSGAFDFLAGILEGLKPIIEFISGVIASFIDSINNKIQIIQAFAKQLENAFNSPQVQQAIQKLQEAFGKLQEAFDKIKTALQPVFDLFNELGKALGLVSDESDKNAKAFVESQSFLDGLIGALETFINIITFVVEAITTVINIFTGLINIIKSVIEFIASLPARFQAIWNTIVTGVQNFVNGIVNFFTVVLPQKINEGIQAVKRFFDELPKKAEEVGFAIGQFIRQVIDFFINLPANIQKGVEEFKAKVEEFFTNAKTTGEQKIRELVDNVVAFFQGLPDRARQWLENFIQSVRDFFTRTRDDATQRVNELVENVRKFFEELPGKVATGLSDLGNKISEKFQELLNKAVNFGKDFVNSIVNGIKSVGDSIGNTINGFFSGIGKGLGLAKGGIVPEVQRFANGGVVKGVGKTLYAAGGAFAEGPRGTDTVPAWLTPGELVLPRGIVNGLMGMLQKITSLPGVSKAFPGINTGAIAGAALGGQMNGGVNVNIGTLNASSADEATRRANDIGFGISRKLRAQGLY